MFSGRRGGFSHATKTTAFGSDVVEVSRSWVFVCTLLLLSTTSALKWVGGGMLSRVLPGTINTYYLVLLYFCTRYVYMYGKWVASTNSRAIIA